MELQAINGPKKPIPRDPPAIITLMEASPRPVCIHHSTSHPFRFFGRAAELALLDEALNGGPESVVALAGPGGQGKTAIVQEWLGQFLAGSNRADGVFFWSFYRGKDADVFLRELYAYALGLAHAGDVSASYCVDHLLPVLRRERFVLILDGAEVVQYDQGEWYGRFLHPELGRLVEELAAEPMPGVLVLTTRFPIPGLERRKHARLINLGGLDAESGRRLLQDLGVRGTADELNAAAASCGFHAKAVELLGTYLVRFQGGIAGRRENLPEVAAEPGLSPEERQAARVLGAFQNDLAPEAQDVLALATAFREPSAEARLLDYLVSPPVQSLLHQTWGRSYLPFALRPPGWLAGQVEDLVHLRLLERVGRNPAGSGPDDATVIDAHPLVRRGFESVRGGPAHHAHARARAGFLRGRPDRRRPDSLEEAREEIELFFAYCDGGLWNEADGVYVSLDNPKHRFLAPALERDLLLRFFPGGDWRRPPLWAGFGRYRSLAICFELLGQFDHALAAYREADAPLRGDALLALARLGPLLPPIPAAPPWQALWQAYRAHALCLAGDLAAALAVARSLVPVDVYEWVHVIECLLRARQLGALDIRSVLFRPPHAAEHRWNDLARRRMRLDYLRLSSSPAPPELDGEYKTLVEAYDRGGLPWERALARLSYGRWLLERNEHSLAQAVNGITLDLGRRYGMAIVEADAWELEGEIARRLAVNHHFQEANRQGSRLRSQVGYHGPGRP
jgi:hypothetical protein